MSRKDFFYISIIFSLIIFFIFVYFFNNILKGSETSATSKLDISHTFILSYEATSRAIFHFKQICNRYPSEEEGLYILSNPKPQNCPSYNLNFSLIGKTNISYLTQLNRKPKLIFKDGEKPFYNWPGKDNKFGTSDDLFMEVKSNYPYNR